MSAATYFVQECPTCGRTLQVRVEYLGRRVVCQHCSAKFEAADPSVTVEAPHDSSLSVLARAEELIEEASLSTIGVTGGRSSQGVL